MVPSHNFLRDLDDQQTFDEASQRIETSDCHNLAVEFGPSQAWCGLNLSLDNIHQLVQQRKQNINDFPCLWLNIWGWTQTHESMIQEIAEHYQLSPRLAHSLCPRPRAVAQATPSSTTSILPKDLKLSQVSSFASIFDAVWHFCTVDFGRHYSCLGWNALFFQPHAPDASYQSKPNAVRIWSSVLLCDDGLVVSVFEAPPLADADLISRVRQNQISVFRNLSRASRNPRSAVLQTAIRSLATPDAPSPDSASEMASLLFYYLFDDWLNLYMQVSGSKYSYGYQLECLRQELMHLAKREQVELLHQLGKQLSTVKSVCRSYQSMIEQLVRKQTVISHPDHMHPTQATRTELTKVSAGAPPNIIRLPLSAVARFERLLDRIELCAMTEINECIAEKEALVQMNYNLISLREAQTIERLTRTTILLAKVTILFLPISLATSYFSMQLKDIESVRVQTYWFTFLAVVLVTITFLIVFEVLSAKYSGLLIYKGFARMALERLRKTQP